MRSVTKYTSNLEMYMMVPIRHFGIAPSYILLLILFSSYSYSCRFSPLFLSFNISTIYLFIINKPTKSTLLSSTLSLTPFIISHEHTNEVVFINSPHLFKYFQKYLPSIQFQSYETT